MPPYLAALVAAGTRSGAGGEARQPETEAPDSERDAIEFSLLEYALAQDLPVLAICRGLQVLNVFQGGSLIQHLNPPDRHQRTDGDRSVAMHAVTIDPDSLLFTIAGTRTWQVNSRHHQAGKGVGKGLRVLAVDAEDGTVEALERPDKRFVVGVQWHPEDQAPKDREQAKIFQGFGAAVGYRSSEAAPVRACRFRNWWIGRPAALHGQRSWCPIRSSCPTRGPRRLAPIVGE